MKAQVLYVYSAGPVSVKANLIHGGTFFNFELFDGDGRLCIYMENENEAHARLAAAAFNGDLAELRRLLDIADGDEMRARLAEKAQEDIGPGKPFATLYTTPEDEA